MRLTLLTTALCLTACGLEDVAVYGIYNRSAALTVTSVRFDDSDNRLTAGPVAPGEEFAFGIRPGTYDVVIEGDSLTASLATVPFVRNRHLKLKDEETYADTLR